MNIPGSNRGRANALILVVTAGVLALGLAAYFLLLREPQGQQTVGQAAQVSNPAAAAQPAPEAPNAPLETTSRTGQEPQAAARATLGSIESVRLAGPGKVRGTLLDRATGQGVGGAQVALLPAPPGSPDLMRRVSRLAKLGPAFDIQFDPVAKSMSAADGSFAFEGVRSGTYFIQAQASLHVLEQVQSVQVLASGEGGPVEVFMRAGGRVLGVVKTPAGEPLAGAKVVLMVGIERLLESARRGELVYLETMTDGRGEFAFLGAPPAANYLLTAVAHGWCLGHQDQVAVRAGEETRVELLLRQGGVVEGRIVAKDAQGALAPLAGAHVAAVPRGLIDLVFVDHVLESTYAATGPDGAYRLSHCPPGEVDVVAWAPKHMPARGPSTFVAEAAQQRAQDFELTSGAVMLGKVVDEQGHPIPGVQVRWNLVDMTEFDLQFSASPLLTQAIEKFEFPLTDVEGRFWAGPFQKNNVRVTFTKLGWPRTTERYDPAVPDKEYVVVMKRGGALEGIVMDAERQEPVRTFSVSSFGLIDSEAGQISGMNPFSGGRVFEAGDGRFRLDPVRTGSVRIEVSAPGYAATQVSDIEVKPGETTRGVIVELSRGGRLSGKVLDPEGRPVAGALVNAESDAEDVPRPVSSAESTSGPRAQPARARRERMDMPAAFSEYAAGLGFFGDSGRLSAADGSFEFQGLAPGNVRVQAFHRDWATVIKSVDVASKGEPAWIEIQMAEGAGLTGVVTDRFDRPVEGVAVLCMAPGNFESDESTGALYQGSTNEAGRYSIRNMASGSYFVMLTRGDEGLSPMSLLGSMSFDMVSIPKGETVEFDLVDTSLGATRVFGQVIMPGQAATRGNVMAMSFESDNMLGVDFKMAAIRGDGSYEFKGLQAGSYQFHVRPMGSGRSGDSVRLEVEVPDAPEYRFDLELPSGVISGRVVDSATKTPLGRVRVTLAPAVAPKSSGFLGQMFRQETSAHTTFTNAVGEFALDGLQAGEWLLSARLEGNSGSSATVYSPAQPTAVKLGHNEILRDVVIALEPGLELTGVVLDPSKQPIADAEVSALPKGGTLRDVAVATTDAKGAFVLRGLTQGAVDVRASHDLHASVTLKDVKVENPQAKPLELVLVEGVNVRVRVVDVTGAAMVGASARLVAVDGLDSALATDPGAFFSSWVQGQGLTDIQGNLDLGRFSPGEYRLEAQRGSAKSKPKQVTLGGLGLVELKAVLE